MYDVLSYELNCEDVIRDIAIPEVVGTVPLIAPFRGKVTVRARGQASQCLVVTSGQHSRTKP